jgi:hypothetical protein
VLDPETLSRFHSASASAQQQVRCEAGRSCPTHCSFSCDTANPLVTLHNFNDRKQAFCLPLP